MDNEARHSPPTQHFTHSDEPTATTRTSEANANDERTRETRQPSISMPSVTVPSTERREDFAAALQCLRREQPFPECHQALQMMLAANVIRLPAMLNGAPSKNIARLSSPVSGLIPNASHACSEAHAAGVSAISGIVLATELSSKTPAISGELPALEIQKQNTNELKKIDNILPRLPQKQSLLQVKKFAEKDSRNRVSEQQHDASQSKATEEMEQLTLEPNRPDVEKLPSDQGNGFPSYEGSHNTILHTKVSSTETSSQKKPIQIIHMTHPMTSNDETFHDDTLRRSTEDENTPHKAEDTNQQPDAESTNESRKTSTSAHNTATDRMANDELLRREGKWTPLVLRPTPKRVMVGGTCIAGLPQQHGNLLGSTLFKNHLLRNKEELTVGPPIPVHQLHPYYDAPHKFPALHQASFVKLHHHLHYHHHHGTSNSVDPLPPAHLHHHQHEQHKRSTAVKRRKMTAVPDRERNDTSCRTSELSRAALDIAACDGPVFFERVLNKAFAGSTVDEVDSDAEIVVDELDPADIAAARERPQQKEAGGFKKQAHRLQQVPATTYHCVYCNHTFKSHYCYQKHMRRHINPITVEVQPRTTAVISSMEVVPRTQQDATVTKSFPVRGSDIMREGSCENSIQNSTSADAHDATQPIRSFFSSTHNDGREDDISNDFVEETPDSLQGRGQEFDVVTPEEKSTMLQQLEKPNTSSSATVSSRPILDLNVQYFPCKTCGSKFPSYYFVHKHRRLCHGERAVNFETTQ